MLRSLVIRPRTSRHGLLPFSRLAYRGPTPQTSVRLRKQLSLLGIGAAIAFAVYHETSSTYNDSDELEQRPPRFTKSSFSSFETDINQQDMLIPDWTDNGIYRVDVAALASNIPIEDASSLYTAAFSPTLRYTFFGVFDGHNGGSTARKLAADLSQVVCLHLADVYSKQCASTEPGRNPGEPPNPWLASDVIHDAVKAAFVEVDDSIVHEATRRVLGLSREMYRALNEGKESSESDSSSITPSMSRPESMKLLKEAYAGSCAILGIYNNLERTLHVAVTGDSRAVLGRRVPVPSEQGNEEKENQSSASSDTRKYAYEVHQLSFDQNATNPKEAERLTALHPDEPELLKKDRVLGWGPARAFGDGIMKWSAAIQKRLWKEFLGDWPRDVLKTPPYFTAEPEVTTFEGVRRGDFLVLASDGLWDGLTNEEVIGLVGKWLEERGSKENGLTGEGTASEVVLPNKNYPSTTIGIPRLHGKDKEGTESGSGVAAKDETYGPSDLPVIYPEGYNDKTVMYKYWRTEKRFASVPEDATNVARHVIRNAVGGADRGLSEALYMMEGSRRRRFRDDITIQIIFFE